MSAADVVRKYAIIDRHADIYNAVQVDLAHLRSWDTYQRTTAEEREQAKIALYTVFHERLPGGKPQRLH
jgi:hypothetical protein